MVAWPMMSRDPERSSREPNIRLEYIAKQLEISNNR